MRSFFYLFYFAVKDFGVHYYTLTASAVDNSVVGRKVKQSGHHGLNRYWNIGMNVHMAVMRHPQLCAIMRK